MTFLLLSHFWIDFPHRCIVEITKVFGLCRLIISRTKIDYGLIELLIIWSQVEIWKRLSLFPKAEVAEAFLDCYSKTIFKLGKMVTYLCME